MEEKFRLPNGRLFDIQARPSECKRVKLGEFNSVHSQKPVTERAKLQELSSTNTPACEATPTAPQKTNRTRLPVLKAVADKDRGLSKETFLTMKSGERSTNLQTQPKRSFRVLELGSPKEADNDCEQYRQKDKHNLDETTSSSRSKERQRDYSREAYRKIISSASSPQQDIAKHRSKHRGNNQAKEIRTGDTNPGSEITLARVNRRYKHWKSFQNLHESHPASQKRDQADDGHSTASISLESEFERSLETESRAYSSHKLHPSVFPLSGSSSSLTEWEDRFVVNMPSARDPNPPTMDAEQIIEFQKRIEKIHKQGGSITPPEALCSRRASEEQIYRHAPREQSLGAFDGQDVCSNTMNEEGEVGLTGASGQHSYFSPGEIGKPRFSTIWEESSAGLKAKSPKANPDGSFLGCREINGRGDINPDEVLFFPTMEEQPNIVDLPPRASNIQREVNQTAMCQMVKALDKKAMAQEKRKQISQNSKHAQCFKSQPRTMCYDTKCQQLNVTQPTKTQVKENIEGKANPPMYPEKHKQLNLGYDDVFIITPTITRTMVTMTDTGSHIYKGSDLSNLTNRSTGGVVTDPRTRTKNVKPQTNASPLGLRRPFQNSKEKPGARSVCSRATPSANIPVVQHRARPETTVDQLRDLRGPIPTLGTARLSTKTLVEPIPNNHQPPVLSSALRTEKIPPGGCVSGTTHLTELYSSAKIAPADSMNHLDLPKNTPRTISSEVAELEGLQLVNSQGDTSKPIALNSDLRDSEMQTDMKGIMNPETLNLIIDILLLYVSQAQALYSQIIAARNSKVTLIKFLLSGIFWVLEQSLQVFRILLAVVSAYTFTAIRPRTNKKDLTHSLAEFGQAMICFVILVFILVMVGRAASYMFLIGRWIMWFAKPLVLILRTVERFLLV